MTTFQGTMWLADNLDSRVSVCVDIRAEGLMVVTAGDMTIGVWDQTELIVEPANDGYHLLVDGEELIFTPDSASFGAALVPDPTPAMAFSRPTLPRLTSLEFDCPREPVRSSLPTPRTDDRPPPPPGVGLGVASVVVGLASVGLMFTSLRVVEIGCGGVALVLGILGSRKVEWWESAMSKAISTGGIILGIVAISLGVMGNDGVSNAFSGIGAELGDMIGVLDSASDLSTAVLLQLQQCTADGASGSVTNNHTEAVDIAINAHFYNTAGDEVATGSAFINDLYPGTKTGWQATTGGAEYAHCRAEISHTFPS
ncbi:MAG: hypothetical protein Q8Q52_05545 [Acidimicrobiia bacterium]|nr:hypothetical protein [Acidimicrobiia bacterium]